MLSVASGWTSLDRMGSTTAYWTAFRGGANPSCPLLARKAELCAEGGTRKQSGHVSGRRRQGVQVNEEVLGKRLSAEITEAMIRVGVIAFLVVMCVRIFEPFMGLVLWALILAVTLYPPHQRLAAKLGGRQGRAATVLVLAGLVVIGVPTAMLGGSAAHFINDTISAVEAHSISIEQPDPSVAQWPLIGQKVYDFWSEAARDLPGLIEKVEPQWGTISKFVLGVVANTAGGILQFLGSLIIAGIMMAYGESGSRAVLRILDRFAGEAKGHELHRLSTATIRSVSLGVIGVAFIQALLLGIGFIWAGVPGAGILALLTLLLGIAQLPALIISLPVIAYIWWSGDSTMWNAVYTVYLIVAGMADNVLKPMLLGRGVDAPMPIVLIGALGGMVSGGMIGLFVGAVLMSLGYVIFMNWVGDGQPKEGGAEAAADSASPTGGV